MKQSVGERVINRDALDLGEVRAATEKSQKSRKEENRNRKKYLKKVSPSPSVKFDLHTRLPSVKQVAKTRSEDVLRYRFAAASKRRRGRAAQANSGGFGDWPHAGCGGDWKKSLGPEAAHSRGYAESPPLQSIPWGQVGRLL